MWSAATRTRTCRPPSRRLRPLRSKPRGPYRWAPVSGPLNVFDLLAAARRYRAGGAGPKATLLAVAERLGQVDGEWVCWPAMATIAFDSEQSVPTVRRHLAAFEERGLVRRRARGAEGGGRASNLLVMNVPALLDQQTDHHDRFEQTDHRRGANRSSAGGQTAHPADPHLLLEVPEEVPRRAKRSPLPGGDSFQPSARVHDAVAGEVPQLDLDVETRKFVSYHLSRGTVMADWDAAWRNWMYGALTKGGVMRQPNHRPNRHGQPGRVQL